MPTVETNSRKIIRRLEAEGWMDTGGSKHQKFTHAGKLGCVVIVPRHAVQKFGTARSIAKAAGWI